jgi:hypothetical protein
MKRMASRWRASSCWHSRLSGPRRLPHRRLPSGRRARSRCTLPIGADGLVISSKGTTIGIAMAGGCMCGRIGIVMASESTSPSARYGQSDCGQPRVGARERS